MNSSSAGFRRDNNKTGDLPIENLAADTASLRVTALGNAGFLIVSRSASILLDPFIQLVPGVQPLGAAAVGKNSSILVTHDHCDHLNVRAVIEAASCGAVVLGPEPAVRALSRHVPSRSLIQLDPDDVGGRADADVVGARVTAFRTSHSRAHNSYLVELDGFRVFDDGDNEHTNCLDRSAIRELDALFLCPWQGSGWVDFIEGIKPRHWFLMHMTEVEFAEHDRGRFLPELCDHIPMNPVALRPGALFTIARGQAA
ncbi:MAG: MBL fold metallo-hydrolase [Verrucomicrobiota bacterium]|nr:MBL fold metallo-hydrolase [Verrucomicrobiota bacterium]